MSRKKLTSQSISVTCTKKSEHTFVYASFYTILTAPQIFFKLSYSIFKILLKASTETLQSFQANHTVKTKRAPFLVKRRRSSKSSYETIGQIKKPTNQTDVIIPQDRTQKCSRQVWFRTALGSSVIMTVSACSIRNRYIQFSAGFLLWLYSNTVHVQCQERSFDFNKFQSLAQI